MGFLVKDDSANSIALIESSPTNGGSEAGCGNGFESNLRSKVHARTLVEKNQNGAFTFLLKNFGMGRECSCSHLPIDRADIIAGLIYPNFTEIHAAALLA
jgi:hypothetical protein